MIYGNGYNPYSYQIPMQDQLSQLRQNNFNQQNTQQQDERIWVQGRGSAESFLLTPNSFVRLWDSMNPNIFYEKRSDASGRPYMETFEYKKITPEVTNNQVLDNQNENIYLKQIKALEKRIEALEGGVKYESESNADNPTI